MKKLLLLVCLFGCTKGPIVEPIPEKFDIELWGSKNETLGFYLPPVTNCITPLLPGNVKVFEIGKVKTVNPSFEGARVGDWNDPLYETKELCPAKEYFADLYITKDAITNIVQVGPFKVKVNVWKMTMPDLPSMPLYSELNTDLLLRAHYFQKDILWSKQEELAKTYAKFLIDHKIHPFHHYSVGKLGGAGWGTVVETSPLELFLPFRQSQTIEETQLKGVAYLFDEPFTIGLGGDEASRVARINTRAQELHTKAPNVRALVTMYYRPDVKGVDIYAPVFEHFERHDFSKGESWGYVSCMTTSCRIVGKLSGTPGMAVELPPVYRKAFYWVGYKYNLKALLYYATNYGFVGYKTGNGYQIEAFGQNGDGTLLGELSSGEGPVATLRMKELREASFDIEYLKWDKADVSDLVKSTREWDKDINKYYLKRKEIGERLNASEN